jgi:hypothetical protein
MKRSLKIVPLFVGASVYRKRETAGMSPTWKRWRTKALTLGFLLCLLVPAAHAQEASGGRPAQASPAASFGSAGPKEGVRDDGDCGGKVPCPISEKIKSLRLDWGRRFARGLQYDVELTEQPGTVLVDFESEGETFTLPIRNPQSYLHKHTFTFKFGELFPERLSTFKRGSEYLKKNPQAAAPDKELSELLCGDKPLITCLTKGGSWWKRALMGTSVNVTLARRQDVVSQTFVTDPRFGKDFQDHYGFVFDPAKLFPTATNWKGTFDDVKGIDKALALLGAGDARGGRQPWKQPWAAALIPKVEFKVLSQFDFMMRGGELREPRFPNRALNTLKFTWDVARAFPDTKSRLDADAITEELVHLENNLGREEEPSQKWCILHLSKEGKAREVKNLHPGFSAASCQRLAKLKNAESYQLSCVKKGTQGGADERVDGPKSISLNAPVPDTPTGNPCKW